MNEIAALRTARSKTFDMGDGTRRLEIGGAIAHHQKDGAWVDTDCTWKDLLDSFSVGGYPYAVALGKANKSLTVTTDSGTVTLTPVSTQTGAKVTVSVSGNTVTLAGLWKGVTCYLVLTPEQPVLHFLRTGSTYVNPQILCSDPAPMMGASYEDTGEAVPTSEAAGVVTYDLSAGLNRLVM